MMLLAQFTPTPVELAAWLGCFVFLVAAVNQVGSMLDRFKGKPANHELGAKAGDLTRRIEELEKQTIEGVTRRRAIYLEIEKVRDGADRKISDLEQRSNARFTVISESISEVPSKVIALLRNTGVIK